MKPIKVPEETQKKFFNIIFGEGTQRLRYTNILAAKH